MSISLATPLSFSSIAAVPAVKPLATSDAKTLSPSGIATKTPFAHILSAGKDPARDQHAPSDRHADTDESKDQPKADTATATTADSAVKPADLTTAADQGVSAVLALIAAAQTAATPAPAPTQTPSAATDTTAIAGTTDATTPIAAPAPAATAVPIDQPVDLATLSPADQHLLRSMMAAFKKDPGSVAPADAQAVADPASQASSAATPAAADTVAPDISQMAAALNRAFGKVGDKAPPKAATPDTTSVVAAPPSLPTGPATAIDPAPKRDDKADDPLTAIADLATPGTDTNIAALVASTDSNSIATNPATSTTGVVQASHAEQSVTRHIDMLKDTQWLDNLAHDISQAANQNGSLKFQINPEHLGSLAVEITHNAAGASIRMTTDNDNARAIIADAQPRLIAEVQAQGLRVADAHVDLGNQASGGGANNRSTSEDHKPFVRTVTTTTEEASDSPPRDDGLYA